MSHARARARDRGLLVLSLVFVALLPLFLPRLYATDSVQYYAYIRSLFFDGDLDFTNEYQRFHELNPRSGIDSALLPKQDPVTGAWLNVDPRTGLPINIAPVGSALLWAPFFLVAHGGVLLVRALGSPVAADGYSLPYIWAICFASAVYGLLGVLLSYRIARRYTGVWPATAAALVCWLAAPLIFYMYISPPWSHTGGLFATALFIWYWLRTRGHRTLRQWLILGALGGLMVLVREQLGLFLILPAGESLALYVSHLRARRWSALQRLMATHAAFLLVFVITLAPQLATYYALTERWGPSTVVIDKLLMGARESSGAVEIERPDPGGNGLLGSRHFWDTLVDLGPSPVTGDRLAHGALLWTPVWAIGLIGLAFLWRRDRGLLGLLTLAFFAQTWVNGAFGTTWHLSGAFGFRRLIEATPIFVLGVALLIDRVRLPRSVWSIAGALLILWNVGLIAQWTVTYTELRRGLVWDGMLRRQFHVPATVIEKGSALLWDRGQFIENEGFQPQPSP
jgi:hypothetical protein